MEQERFEQVITELFEECNNILNLKGREYATEDRLHNFKQAAHLRQTTIEKALGGMLVKHTVSIFDMIENDGVYSMPVWAEKIVDHINYLALLWAVLMEKTMDSLVGESVEDNSDRQRLADEALEALKEQNEIDKKRKEENQDRQLNDYWAAKENNSWVNADPNNKEEN